MVVVDVRDGTRSRNVTRYSTRPHQVVELSENQILYQEFQIAGRLYKFVSASHYYYILGLSN